MLAVDGKNVEYVGGTWGQFEQGAEGKLDLSDASKAVFVPSKKKSASAEIPYDKVLSLKYGQMVSVRPCPFIGCYVVPQKRKHYLTVGYTDAAGKTQGVVLELGKDIMRGTLTAFEARTGKQIEYESEDAKKNIGN